METPPGAKLPAKFKTVPQFDWRNKVVTLTITFTSIEEAGKSVDFLKAMSKVMWPDIMFRGDDDWVEETSTSDTDKD